MVERRSFIASLLGLFASPKFSSILTQDVEQNPVSVLGSCDGDTFIACRHDKPKDLPEPYLHCVQWERVKGEERLWKMRFCFSDGRYFHATTTRFDFWWGNLLYKHVGDVLDAVPNTPDMTVGEWWCKDPDARA